VERILFNQCTAGYFEVIKEAVMKAEIKALETPGVVDLWDYKADDNGDFKFRLEMFVGPAGKERSDLFTAIVCSPSRVKNFFPKKDFLIIQHREKGVHYIVMKRYDYSILRNFLEDYVHNCRGWWWGFISWQIRKIAKWERKAKNIEV
jgi:hypothetical protein